MQNKKSGFNLLTLFIFLFGFALSLFICWLFWILDEDTFFVLVLVLLFNAFWFYALYGYIMRENRKEISKGKISFTLYLAFSLFIYWFCWLLFIKYSWSILFTTPLLLTCVFFGIHKIKRQKEELSLKFDENKEEILWESKKQFEFVGLGFFIFDLYRIVFIGFIVWVLLTKSLWLILLVLFIDYFCIETICAMLNFKAMFITQKGLTLKTRWFNREVFYPYGSFVIKSESAGVRMFSERVTIFCTKHSSKYFIFPIFDDNLGVFKNNQKFKELCTKYTELALETMNIEEKVELYKLYRANIRIAWSDEEIHYNAFKINFNPYLEELKAYFYKEKQEMFENMNTLEKVENYKIYEKLYKKTKSLEFDTSYFEPYLQDIKTHLKDKNESKAKF